MPVEAQNPDFHRIYFDTNVLLRGQGWPVPSILLNNLLKMAALCGIDRFVPEPVLKEAEEHWLRDLAEGAVKLSNAKRDLDRYARPIHCEITLMHSSIDSLLTEYRERVSKAVKEYGIVRTPFAKRTVEEVFGLATKYVLPFGPKGEGKGFQDAVILLSVLDHLQSSSGVNAIFVTADEDFTGIDFASLAPGFDSRRIRVISLEASFEFLSERYYQESVVKPYELEKKNALAAAEAETAQITEFVRSLVTVDMMKPSALGGSVTKLLSLEYLTILSVETPLPDPSTPDRSVEILIKVIAAYKVLMAGGLRAKGGASALSALLRADTVGVFELVPPSEEQETYAFWRGGIQARSNVVKREFKNIQLINLVAEDSSLPEAPTSLKARGFAEFLKTRKIEEQIVERTRIPTGTLPNRNEATETEASGKDA